jgi:HEPN superfamily RiboL-PSP-like protein
VVRLIGLAMAQEAVDRAISEIENTRNECLTLLTSLKNFHPLAADQQYPPTYRLIVTPMLYSAWERCFTICHAVGLRLLRDIIPNPQSLSATTRAVWLIRTPFFQGLVSKLQNQVNAEVERPKKGQFSALCEFLSAFDDWAQKSLDTAVDTSELVMTFSNVNPSVVELNAQAMGISTLAQFSALKLGRLNDLVGRRNDIGHGGIIEPPSNENFVDLWAFTEQLIEAYCDLFVAWMQQHDESELSVSPAGMMLNRRYR